MIMHHRAITTTLGIIVACIFLSWSWGIHAGADESDLFHKKLSIKHQAHRAESRQNNRVSYHYISDDQEGLLPEEMAGNLSLGADVKKAYVYTVISKKTLKSLSRQKEPLKMGVLEFEGRPREIVHILEVDGKVTSFFHQSVEIGNIHLRNGKTRVENIILINGSIYAN